MNTDDRLALRKQAEPYATGPHDTLAYRLACGVIALLDETMPDVSDETLEPFREALRRAQAEPDDAELLRLCDEVEQRRANRLTAGIRSLLIRLARGKIDLFEQETCTLERAKEVAKLSAQVAMFTTERDTVAAQLDDFRTQVARLTAERDAAIDHWLAGRDQIAAFRANESDLLAELDATKLMCTQNGRDRDAMRGGLIEAIRLLSAVHEANAESFGVLGALCLEVGDVMDADDVRLYESHIHALQRGIDTMRIDGARYTEGKRLDALHEIARRP